MSEPKVQLIDPQGNINMSGLSATGVITATSYSGSGGAVTGLTGTPNLNLGIVTATSFVGQGDGHAAGLTGTPNLNLGVTTATSFVGDATGKAAGLTGTPNLNVGLVTATGFSGNVTGTVTGNVTGLAASVTPGVNLGVGVCTAIQYHGDGSGLTGVGGSTFIAQQVTANSGETTIDLSAGNLIYYTSSSNTTIGFANTSPAEQIMFVRDTTNDYTITWPDRVKWTNGITPTLADTSNDVFSFSGAQIFRFTTFDTGVNYQGWEEMQTQTGFNLFTWGFNEDGELGLNDVYSRSSPTQVPNTSEWTTVYAEKNYGVVSATKSDGTLWAWGEGLNTIVLNVPDAYNFRSSPTQIPGTDWTVGAVGKHTAAAIKNGDQLWMWGRNGYGELGQNEGGAPPSGGISSPIQVPGAWKNTGFTRTVESMVCIKTDNTLWAWGHNQQGNLGQNDQVDYSSPTQIGTETTWSRACVLAYSGIAVKTDGTLWTWGSGTEGGLGLNDQVKRSSPTQVGTDTDWSKCGGVAYGKWAIKTDGTLWVWGDANSGKLGLNGTADRSSPVQIPGTTWNDVKTNGSNNFTRMLATKTDGTLWCWGNNSYGSFGQNQSPQVSPRVSSPTQISGSWRTEEYAISNGDYNIIALHDQQ